MKTLDEIREFFAQSHHHAMLRNGHKVCEECGGEGELEYERAVVDRDNGGWLEGYTDVCNFCEGEGYVEAETGEED